MAPQVFFNRGFRSTGHAHALDLAERELLPQADAGQQAGCLADLNGDGAQDMVIVLSNGEGWIFYREVMDVLGLAARAVLPVGGDYAGPVTVVGWTYDRCLGARNVVPGTGEGFLGQIEAGPCKLTWRFPGGKPRQRETVVENEAVRVILTP
jgi:hypothetical protein